MADNDEENGGAAAAAAAGGDEDAGGALQTNRDFEFSDTQHVGYGGQMKESCSGACFGFVLFFISIALLVFNEGTRENETPLLRKRTYGRRLP
jgi:hypothetical protein